MLKYTFKPTFNYNDLIMLLLASCTFGASMYLTTAFILIIGGASSAWFEMKYWKKQEPL